MAARLYYVLLFLCGVFAAFAGSRATVAQVPANPAAWGSDHVGQPVPDYVHGDECLFCHRFDIGSTWQQNAHAVTMRQREDAPALAALVAAQPPLKSVAADIEFFLGSRHRVRLLKKAGYGKVAMLNLQMGLPGNGTAQLIGSESPAWDTGKFGDRCAGCHATGVDTKTKAFTAFGLDCYTCHGDVPLDHSKDTSLVWWSQKRRDDPAPAQVQAMMSICAQCHVRSGRSKSTGLPYPNTFIAGDNLFRDFEIDLARADETTLNPGDRHVFRNLRDVLVSGQTMVTCTDCHRVHANSSNTHRLLRKSAICFDCHEADARTLKTYPISSTLCEYDAVRSR